MKRYASMVKSSPTDGNVAVMKSLSSLRGSSILAPIELTSMLLTSVTTSANMGASSRNSDRITPDMSTRVSSEARESGILCLPILILRKYLTMGFPMMDITAEIIRKVRILLKYHAIAATIRMTAPMKMYLL